MALESRSTLQREAQIPFPFLQLHYNVPRSDSRGNANLGHMHSEDGLKIR